MSAITGIYEINKESVNLQHAYGLMTALQKYPADSIQIWYSEKVFLGCHAQWITPESVGEQLPFYDFERRCTITADAIIDNREELYQMLQVKPIHQKGMTDSELILLSYYKWEEDAPKFLVGDFAFVIWDEKRQKMFGARDYGGSRTLYYYRDQHRFVFSTTIDPLFSLPYVQKTLNDDWLAEHLAIPDMVDAANPSSTVYRYIEQIPPSHTISIVDKRVSLSRFSAITMGKQLRLKSNGEYEEAFREVFQKAVNAKIRTHKNVGAQLSGGLDSGSVVSFAANTLRKERKRVHTFSYIPTDDFVDFTPKHRVADERPFIQSIVQHVGNINDDYLDFKGKSSLSEMDEMLEIMEMPYKFFENSFWLKGTYEKAHEQGVGVLLNGAGGNFTISWGPAMEHYAVLLKKIKWMRLYKEMNLYSKNTEIKKSKVFSAIRKTAFPNLTRKFPLEDPFSFPILINQDFADRTKVFAKLNENGIDHVGSSLTNAYEARKDWFEKEHFWNASGTASAKLSLRYALWNRDPTNDLRVIRYCLSVPEEQFVQQGYNRSLIRRSTKDYLPDNVRLNQRVRGIQAADWVHRITPSWKPLMDELQQLTKGSVVAEFLNIGLLNTLISKFKAEPRSEYAFNPEFRVLMRSLIVYRFIKNLT
ncbi:MULTISPECIES: lasso peptide isopeptide bond-forming cyclase [Bacillaceae]|uniref:lasso peptide isopeptide bond-forming cyclase n=1 Tax=Bacillaceae TaxID=186817 RepID=UPI00065FEE3D|nr:MULTISPECIES: lasso peptide isopeptide bond-forming cyclase [Bacillaceae]MCF7623642.1 lasso peptide isopeptide bond-forming cyclase [Peribacillus frigoritolerans]PRA94480.1 asparagine synthetase B [Peribacillus simplex]